MQSLVKKMAALMKVKPEQISKTIESQGFKVEEEMKKSAHK